MPYSVDSEQNRDNAYSPSPMTMENQLLYKVSALESTLKGFMIRLDERFDRLQKEITDRHTDIVGDMAKLEIKLALDHKRVEDKVDTNDKRIKQLEEWKTILTTRLITAGSIIIVCWTLFGRAVQDFIARVFN